MRSRRQDEAAAVSSATGLPGQSGSKALLLRQPTASKDEGTEVPGGDAGGQVGSLLAPLKGRSECQSSGKQRPGTPVAKTTELEQSQQPGPWCRSCPYRSVASSLERLLLERQDKASQWKAAGHHIQA